MGEIGLSRPVQLAYNKAPDSMMRMISACHFAALSEINHSERSEGPEIAN